MYTCVHRSLALSHHQRGTDFGREGGCGGPSLCAPSTSARVQNRLSSWSLVVICPLIAPDATGIAGSYDRQLVVSEVPLYKFENIGYVQGTRAPPVCYVRVSRMYESSYFIPGTRCFCCCCCCCCCCGENHKVGTTYRDKEGENARDTRYQVVVAVVVVVVFFTSTCILYVRTCESINR